MALLNIPSDQLKNVREALCLAQSALCQMWPYPGDRPQDRAMTLQKIVDAIDIHRPLGSDGSHGERHTATCGCE